MIVIIDNYDSFTYNIYQYLCELTDIPVEVIRNNEISLDALIKKNPDYLIISPGPGRPDDGGISKEAILHFTGKIPVLGVCLGHQCIAEAFGGDVVQSARIVHGKVEAMTHDGKGVFRGLNPNSPFTRYHSLAVKKETLPDKFEVSATSTDGEIMGIRHKEYILEGIQFHPESMGSPEGKQLLKNFLKYKRKPFNKKYILNSLIAGKNLTREEASEFMDELTDGNLSPAYTAAVLMGLNCKGIVPEEIIGCASVLIRKKKPVNLPFPALDIVGTGGDGLKTFNISSFSALVAAACGAKIAKHGNRAVSSSSGASDFYTALGINIMLSPEQSAELIEKTGFGFLFAPLFHGAMRFAAPPRKEMGIKSIMNLLGPLVNPASAEYQLIGVYDKKLCPVMAEAAKALGVKRVMTINSQDGMDEFSLSAPTRMYMIDENGSITDSVFDPESLGIEGYTLEDIVGGTPDENAKDARDILERNGKPALIEICSLNAGAALFVSGEVDSLKNGYKKAKKAIESGALKEKITAIVSLSGELGG